MGNAQRNVSDMISSLQMQYNRSRQAAITNELVDIITGRYRILSTATGLKTPFSAMSGMFGKNFFNPDFEWVFMTVCVSICVVRIWTDPPRRRRAIYTPTPRLSQEVPTCPPGILPAADQLPPCCFHAEATSYY